MAKAKAKAKQVELGDTVQLAMSGEQGKVIGVAHYIHGPAQFQQFQVEYLSGDGCQVVGWWRASSLLKVS